MLAIGAADVQSFPTEARIPRTCRTERSCLSFGLALLRVLRILVTEKCGSVLPKAVGHKLNVVSDLVDVLFGEPDPDE